MKRILSACMTLAIIASMSTAVVAAEATSREGNADLVLTEGKLLLLDVNDSETMGGLPGAYTAVKTMGVDFNTHTITGVDKQVEGVDLVGALVQDARGYGDNSQWNVTVKLSKFKLMEGDTVTETETLKGAQVTLSPEGNVITSLEAGVGPARPSHAQKILDPTANEPVQVFTSASKEAGGSAGVWGANWKAFLDIPSTAESGTHRAVLTWAIQNGI